MVWVYLAIHLGAVAVFWIDLTPLDWLLFVLLVQGRGFCVGGGYHRGLAHRSYHTSRLIQFLLASGACTALRGGPLWWVALHRHHHKHSDSDQDTFSPQQGFWWSYVGWLISGRFDTTNDRLVRDLKRFPELAWLNRWWLLPPAMLLGAITLWRGWAGGVVFCLSSVLLFHSMAALDSLNHWIGRRRYATGDSSRNNFVLSLITMGEGWHNNHHQFPTSARSGLFWWEVDGTWMWLRVLAMCGLVWNLKTPAREALGRNLARDQRTVTESPGSGTSTSSNPMPRSARASASALSGSP